MKIYFSILLIVLLISGCKSAFHVIPSDDSYKMNPGSISSDIVFQVVFDQTGVIYPLSENCSVEKDPGGIGNYAFTIRSHNRDTLKGICHNDDEKEQKKDHYDDKKELYDLAKRINKYLDPDKKLIILIHGFSNNISDARKTYATAREQITKFYKDNNMALDYVILQVHWDGLYNPNGLLKGSVSHWWKAVANSKLIGMNGFRELLTYFPTTTPIRILTTSRGSAVAVSAFAKQNILDKSRRILDKYHEFDLQSILDSEINNFTDVRMALIAPAISISAFDNLPKNGFPINKIIIGYNKKDRVLKKEFINALKILNPGPKFESTVVGYDPDAVKKLDIKFPDTSFEGVEFKNLKDHDGRLYLKNPAFREEVLPKFLKD